MVQPRLKRRRGRLQRRSRSPRPTRRPRTRTPRRASRRSPRPLRVPDLRRGTGRSKRSSGSRRRRPVRVITRSPCRIYVSYPWYPRRPRPIYRDTVYVVPRAQDLDPLRSSLSAAALAALRREGLYTFAWRERLREAKGSLIRFINSFHRSDGFALVVRDSFADRDKRRVARLAVRAAYRLADGVGGAERLRFRRVRSVDADGAPLVTLELLDKSRARRYRLLPWSRLSIKALRRLALRDRTPGLRYVFDGNRLAKTRLELARAVRRALRQDVSDGVLSERRVLELVRTLGVM